MPCRSCLAKVQKSVDSMNLIDTTKKLSEVYAGTKTNGQHSADLEASFLTITTWSLSDDNSESADDWFFFLPSSFQFCFGSRHASAYHENYIKFPIHVWFFLLYVSNWNIEINFLFGSQWISQFVIVKMVNSFIELALETVPLKNPWRLGLMRSVFGGK